MAKSLSSNVSSVAVPKPSWARLVNDQAELTPELCLHLQSPLFHDFIFLGRIICPGLLDVLSIRDVKKCFKRSNVEMKEANTILKGSLFWREVTILTCDLTVCSHADGTR